jgi:hypothetical protein
VNADGFDDLLASASLWDGSIANAGGAFVFHGRAQGIANGNALGANARLTPTQASPGFGSGIAAAGDPNGDGYADILVGAQGADSGRSDEGLAYLFQGGANGIGTRDTGGADAVFEGAANNTWLGSAVASGDFDGDGFADAVVGARQFTSGQSSEGGAFVFLANAQSGRPVLAGQSALGAGGAPRIQPYGGSPDVGFDVSLVATHPQGRGLVELEAETCPNGVAFGDPACTTRVSPRWTDVTASAGGVPLSISFAESARLYHWRARVLHAPYSQAQPGIAQPLHPSHGPWRRALGRAQSSDLRVLPEPGAALGLACGAGLLAALARRRSSMGSRAGLQ